MRINAFFFFIRPAGYYSTVHISQYYCVSQKSKKVILREDLFEGQTHEHRKTMNEDAEVQRNPLHDRKPYCIRISKIIRGVSESFCSRQEKKGTLCKNLLSTRLTGFAFSMTLLIHVPVQTTMAFLCCRKKSDIHTTNLALLLNPCRQIMLLLIDGDKI